MIDLLFWAPVMCCGALAGATTGMLGTYIVGMRVPFLGVCVSHAALAGAVFGSLCGLTGPALMLPALAGAAATALALGVLDPESARVDSNVLLGMLFSLTMGLAFLGLGLFSVYGISDNEVRSLLWGSLNFCRWRDFHIMAGAAILEVLVVAAFYKELRAILFSRAHAAAAGVTVTPVWTIFLILTSVVLTVNFQTVGGLMIYSLLTNPAVAAFLLVKGYGKALALSAILGLASGLGGFLLAALADLPTGAMIVILSSLLVGQGFRAVVYGDKGFLKVRGDESGKAPLPVGQWKLQAYMLDRTGMAVPKKTDSKAEPSVIDILMQALGPTMAARAPRSTSVSATASSKCEPVEVIEGKTSVLPFGPPYRPVVDVQYPQDANMVSLGMSLLGVAGEICTDMRVNGNRPGKPKFTITTADGKTVAEGEFEYG